MNPHFHSSCTKAPPGTACRRDTPSGFGPPGFTSLAVYVWLTASLFLVATVLPFTTHAQNGSPGGAFNVADVDSGKVQPLNLKPGCWQVRTQGNTDMNLANLPAPAEPPPPKLPSVDEAMKQWLDHLTPDQRAHLTQVQIDQTREILKANLEHPIKAPSAAEIQKQQAEFLTKTLAKGGNLTQVVCTATPFLPQGKELYGTGTKECTRSIQASGQELLGHVACPGRVTDYKRIDSEHFSGTLVSTGVSHLNAKTDVPYTTTETTTSKWISEASPHLPYSPPMTDLDGRRPRAPYEVATFDPYRIVAIIDEKKFIAQQAYFLLNNSSNGAAENWGPNLVNVMQKIYMRFEIYVEAARIQERQRHPGKYPSGAYVPLPNGGVDPYEQPNCCVVPGGTVDRDRLGHDSTATTEHQDATYQEGDINWGWDFYFSQARTPEEKQALLRKVQEKYKVTVVDPDFFFGTRRD